MLVKNILSPVTDFPKQSRIIPGMAMRPFYGIQPVICDPATGKGKLTDIHEM